MIQICLLLVVGAISLAYYWLLKQKNFWKDQNIPYIEAPLLVGNFGKSFFLKEHVTTAFERIYHHPNARGKSFVGVNIFNKPAIVVLEPELVKRVLVRDFNYFANRHSGFHESHDPVGGNNLFGLNNPKWKAMRSKVTPVFTSGKLKQMFPILLSVGENLNQRTRQISKINSTDMDLRDLVGAYMLDSICLVSFATETRALLQDRPSEFLMMMAKSVTSSYWKKVSMNAFFFMPEIGKYLRLTSFSRDFDKALTELFHDVYQDRLRSGAYRGDLIDALIAVKKDEANDVSKCKS